MAEAAKNGGKKLLALAVLLVAAWILFKVVLGAVTGIAVVVLAIVAVVWAIRVL